MRQTTLKICKGKACKANFSRLTKQRALEEKEKHNLKNLIVEDCGCQGQCKTGPTVVYETNKHSEKLSNITPIKMGQLIKKLK